MSSEGPLPLIVSSPSGAGKTTLTTRLLTLLPELRFSVSHTTRKPRQNEQDGREYHFVDRARFLKLIEQGAFLEWAEVHGNLYGTGKAELHHGKKARGIIFDIDHQGARQIKSSEPDAVAVFILPPSMAILEKRLRGRASEDEETVQRRFNVALREIEHYGLFDYVLVNEDLDEATKQLESIFRAEECRRHRAARHAERLLAEGRGFGGSTPPG
ncbi:MAG TPA: guanylate kinase [Polyangiaceae bacterium]|jgi:guanylate kinase|nr:guanylate kinase [Polyangiaceae bacterium]